MKFHETYYSANLMKLVVLGREPLDVLQQWVVEKFSAVRNKDLQAPDFPGEPYTEKELLVNSLFLSALIAIDWGSCEACQRSKVIGDGLPIPRSSTTLPQQTRSRHCSYYRLRGSRFSPVLFKIDKTLGRYPICWADPHQRRNGAVQSFHVPYQRGSRYSL